MRDPAAYALAYINRQHEHSLAELFRECQQEAYRAGQKDLIKIAVDSAARVNQIVATVRQDVARTKAA